MVNPSPEQQRAAIAAHALKTKISFMAMVIRLDERQLMFQLETLLECRNECESHDERASTDLLIDFVNTTGRLVFNMWDANKRAHFVGEE